MHSQTTYFQKFREERAPAPLEARASGAHLVRLLIGSHPPNLPTGLVPAGLFPMWLLEYIVSDISFDFYADINGEQHIELVDLKKKTEN